jgi:hypothetical protein
LTPPTPARLTHYRSLRSLQQALVERILDLTPHEALDRSAQALGFWDQGRPRIQDPTQAALIYEVALYDDRDAQGLSLMDRAAAANPSVPLLAAMASARVDLWRVEEARPDDNALRLLGRLSDHTLWLTDEGLSRSAAPGDVLTLRPIPIDGLAMSSGVAIPVPPALVEATVAALIMATGVGSDHDLSRLPPAEASTCAVALLSLSAAAGATARLKPR